MYGPVVVVVVVVAVVVVVVVAVVVVLVVDVVVVDVVVVDVVVVVVVVTVVVNNPIKVLFKEIWSFRKEVMFPWSRASATVALDTSIVTFALTTTQKFEMVDSAAIALVCSLVTAVEALIRALYTDVLTL